MSMKNILRKWPCRDIFMSYIVEVTHTSTYGVRQRAFMDHVYKQKTK
jgi:hypothetical protein